MARGKKTTKYGYASAGICGLLLLVGLIILICVCVSKSNSPSSRGKDEFRHYQTAYPDGYGPAPNKFMGVAVPKGALKDTNPKYKVAETAAAYGVPFNVALGKYPLQYNDQFGNSLLNGKGVQQHNAYPPSYFKNGGFGGNPNVDLPGPDGYTPSVTSASVGFIDLAANVPTTGIRQNAWDWQRYLGSRMPEKTETPFFTDNNWNKPVMYGTTPWNRAQFGIRPNPYDQMPGGVTSTDFFRPYGPNWIQSQSVPFISSVNAYAPMNRVPGNFEKIGILTKVGQSGSGKDILNLFQKPIAPLQDLFEYQVENKDGFVIPINARYLEDGDTVANVTGLGGPWKVHRFDNNKYVYM